MNIKTAEELKKEKFFRLMWNNDLKGKMYY